MLKCPQCLVNNREMKEKTKKWMKHMNKWERWSKMRVQELEGICPLLDGNCWVENNEGWWEREAQGCKGWTSV
jgi:hypothetical protein